MSDLDVLIVGGYGLTERAGAQTRDKIRLKYGKHLATQDFIKFLVRFEGDLEKAEKNFLENNKSRLVSRSLNSIYLLDYLTKNDIRTDVVNYYLLEQSKFKQLMETKPKAVVISTTFISDVEDINLIAKTAKDISPNSIIIAGGIKILKSYKKFNLYKDNYFDGYDTDTITKNNFFFSKELDQFIDYFVIEECGELTLLSLINKIKSKEDLKCTPNIAYYDKGKLIFTKQSKEPYTFENNFISWDKIPSEILGQEVPVRAGIGCPFKCAFCDFTGLHKVKIRTIDNLVEELKLIQKAFPGRSIFFTDDNLFTTKKRTKELAESILKAGLKFRWRGFFRVDAISKDNVETLAKSGCVNCLLGVESGDETILRNMNKRATRDQTLNAVKLLNQNGINTLSTIILGFPGETQASVDNTISLLNSYPDDGPIINNYYPFVLEMPPLAPVASPQSRVKYGITGGGEDWKHKTMNVTEAREQLLRCFKEITVTTLQYPEFYDPEIPFTNLKKIFKARDNLVKDGITEINRKNSSQVYQKFREQTHA